MRKKKAKKNSPKMHKLKPPPKSYCPQKKCKKLRVWEKLQTHTAALCQSRATKNAKKKLQQQTSSDSVLMQICIFVGLPAFGWVDVCCFNGIWVWISKERDEVSR